MPSTMLSIHQSRYDSIEDTVAALQETIKNMAGLLRESGT
jgi:hypothetical protein